MSNLLLPFSELQNPNCICAGLLDPEDIACYALGGGLGKYQFLDENSPFVAQALADCGGLGLGTVRAKSWLQAHDLPDFVPVVTRGSKKLFEHFAPPYAAVMIDDIVTKRLKVYPDVRRRMGIPAGTKVILLGYGLDELIENVWPRHREVFTQLRNSGIDLVVPMDYSVWHSQPHLERCINIKRSLVVFETLQSLGFEAVSHMYWSGPADLRRWAVWVNTNSCVEMLAIDLQTIGSNERALWQKSIAELVDFTAQLNRPMRYLISGPQTPGRITDIFRALGPNVTFTNGRAAILAWNYKALRPTSTGLVTASAPHATQRDLLQKNTSRYMELVRYCKRQHFEQALISSLGDDLSMAQLEKLSAQIRRKQGYTRQAVPGANRLPLPSGQFRES